ncbi:hypothetical protein [Demequina sp.]|uniref:hypothetical protein n=1 Tax=Demequina sp. TaxID=2050685 RepID=UPI003A856C72
MGLERGGHLSKAHVIERNGARGDGAVAQRKARGIVVRRREGKVERLDAVRFTSEQVLAVRPCETGRGGSTEVDHHVAAHGDMELLGPRVHDLDDGEPLRSVVLRQACDGGRSRSGGRIEQTVNGAHGLWRRIGAHQDDEAVGHDGISGAVRARHGIGEHGVYYTDGLVRALSKPPKPDLALPSDT